LQWPPQAGFESLVRETTRTISNYHWAYEGYTYHRVAEGDHGPYSDCLLKAEEYSKLRFDGTKESPRDLALAVAARSIEIAPTLGEDATKFFGTNLKLREFDLANGKGSLDYADLAIRPDLMQARKDLQDTTCEALANGVVASRKLLEWALQP